jgi:hypothetical protein
VSARPGQYVRDHYGVPAFIGRPIIYTYDNEMPRLGKITGFDGQYLIVKFDDDRGRHGRRERMHPTWEIRYPLDHDGLPLEANDD